MAQKKKAPASAGNTGKGKITKSAKQSNSNIAESSSKCQEKKKKVPYTLESMMKTIAIKIYEEQLGEGGIPSLQEAIAAVDENKMQVIAVLHNRDKVGDDFFVPSEDKPHIHLIERSVDGNPRRIKAILNMLGIKLRPEEDANLWEHAVDKAGNFAKYAAYLLHLTKEAQDDGKARYELEELMSNISKEDIHALALPYIYTGKEQPKNATIDEQSNWRDIARAAGYNMEPYDEFESKVPLVILKQIERFIVRAYGQGQSERVEEVRRSDFTRCAIFIKGKENEGKTYAATHAFDDLGYKAICIDEATKTGKFDKLTAHHKVMIVDDAIISNVLGLADDRPVECYRRNKENPYFIGEYFIVTSNLSFDDWCRECGITNDRQLAAARSRFFVCENDDIDGVKYLRIDSRATRGKAEKLQRKIDMMVAFKKRYEALIKDYNPADVKVDDSALYADDPVPKPAEKKPAGLAGQAHINDYIGTKEDDECLPFSSPEDKFKWKF